MQGGASSDRGRPDRHLISAALYPCYGQMSSTGRYTHRPTVCSIVTFLAIFPATFPDAYGQ